MAQNYSGNTTGITGHPTVTISEPVDTDVRNAASVQTPLRRLADFLQYVATKAGLIDLANTWSAVQAFTAASLDLTAGTAQAILKKTGGKLQVGTAVATDLEILLNNVLKWTFRQSDGALVSAGMALTGLPTPSAASDAATKTYADARETAARAYADSLAAVSNALTAGTPTPTAGWSLDADTYLVKTAAGIVHYYFVAQRTSGTQIYFVTLPAGYRPSGSVMVTGYNQTKQAVIAGSLLGSAGTITLQDAAAKYATNDWIYFSGSFKAA